MSDRFDRQLLLRTALIVSSVAAIVLAWFVTFHQGYTLEEQAKSVGVVKDLLAITAIVIGALWSIRIYLVSRTEREAVSVEQSVKTLRLADERYLLRVLVTLRNIGKVKVEFKTWRLRADLILPVLASVPVSEVIAKHSAFSEHTAEWRWLTNPKDGTFSGDKFHITLEPGESELQIGNLVIPKWAEVVQVYSHFERRTEEKQPAASNPEGWSQRTIVVTKDPNEK